MTNPNMRQREQSHSFGFSTKSFEMFKKPVEKVKNDTILQPKDTGFSKPIALDTNFWLSQAASEYNISPNIEDYIITPVIAVVSDLPNTNGDAFSKKQLLKFNPDAGMLAYQTFKGKPCHQDHVNKDHTIAKGVILDVDILPLKGYNGNHVKLVHLAAFDRTRDPRLCNEILRNKSSTYSMGAYYDSYSCSICGHEVGKTKNSQPCDHTQLRRPTYMDSVSRQLAFRFCNNITGFELSHVGDPAFISAISDHYL